MVISPNKGHRVKLERLRVFGDGDAVIQQEQGVLNGMPRYICNWKSQWYGYFLKKGHSLKLVHMGSLRLASCAHHGTAWHSMAICWS